MNKIVLLILDGAHHSSRKWDYAEILPCKDTREASGASKYSIGDGQPGGQEERGGSVQKRWLGMTPWLFQKGTASFELQRYQ